MSTIRIVLKNNAKTPTRATSCAAGYDLYANENKVVEAGKRAMITSGVVMEIPDGYYGRIAPRSGLAVKYGINVLAGVCDSDYRDEIRVVLQNHGSEDFAVAAGDRIAQIIIEPYASPALTVVDSLTDTERGTGGFGSTGK